MTFPVVVGRWAIAEVISGVEGLNAVLDDMTLSAAAEVLVEASLSVTLSNMTSVTDTQIEVLASLGVTLEDMILNTISTGRIYGPAWQSG